LLIYSRVDLIVRGTFYLGSAWFHDLILSNVTLNILMLN